MNNEISIFCPATVANVSCGYDVLGFCLDGIGDIMKVSKKPEKGIEIRHIDNYQLSEHPNENVAGIAASALIEDFNPECGFIIEIDKKIKPGSGIGSSAASATGAVFAINELLSRPYNKTELVNFAIKGEAYASKCEHADNLAPAIFGGFTLVKSIKPLKIIALPTPADLFVTILHPQIEVKTSEAKSILPENISLKKAIGQWANVGSFVHALHSSDYKMMESSLVDFIVEPYRAKLIPHFFEVKKNAMKSGALGCGISGSGPSIYALSKGLENANNIKANWKKLYGNLGIEFEIYVSAINMDGIRII